MCPPQGEEAAGPVPAGPRPRLLQRTRGHLPSEYPVLLCLPLLVRLRAHGGLPGLTVVVRVPHLPVALLPGVRGDAAGAHRSHTKCLFPPSLTQAPRSWVGPREAGAHSSTWGSLAAMARLPCLKLGFWTFPRQSTHDRQFPTPPGSRAGSAWPEVSHLIPFCGHL